MIWASVSLAFRNSDSSEDSFGLSAGSNSSESSMNGFSRQAITFNLSDISSANIFPGCVKWDKIPLNPGRFTAITLFLFIYAFLNIGFTGLK